jgi:hypothetical protein
MCMARIRGARRVKLASAFGLLGGLKRGAIRTPSRALFDNLEALQHDQ